MQVFDNLSHALLRSSVNVQLIYIADADDVHLNIERLSHDFFVKQVTLSCGKLLGIIQAVDKNILRQNYRSNNERSGQRAATGLIHAGNKLLPCSVAFALKGLHFVELLLGCLKLLLTLVIGRYKLLHTTALILRQLCKLLLCRLTGQQLLYFCYLHIYTSFICERICYMQLIS